MQREVGKRMGGGLVLGRRSYEGAQAAELQLIEALTSTTGVIVATYRPA